MGNRVILHVDMDAFFVSVELRRRPDLRGQPVVVGGTGPRGVVAAASYEARRYGVFSAMPSIIARRRCPHAVFLPGNHDRYGEVSEQVHEIFGRYTPLIEPLSLDEAFLDVSGATRLFGGGTSIAARIRADVRDELELGCSVGVAPNKFIAKMASVEAKPRALADRIDPGRGVVEVLPGHELDFLHPLAVSRLWGVGPKTLEKLERLGIRTIGDLAALDERSVIGSVGAGQGQHLLALAHGRDDRPVEVSREAKSIGHEETFASNVHTDADVHRHVVRLADAVAHRLRRADVAARTVTLKVRFDDGFRTITRSTTPPDPVNTGPGLVAALEPILAVIDPSPGVRLLGVSGSNLVVPSAQLSLLDEAPGGRDGEAAASAIDAIRDRFGMSSIAPASTVDAGRVRITKQGAQQWGPTQSEEDSADPRSP